MNTAIIVAAGQGTRFGGQTPKQFLEILGKPVVIHTMLKFEACPAVDEIVLVLPADHKASFLEIAQKFPLKKLTNIVNGGASRSQSVRNGFKAIQAESANIVAIHDGARPLVTPDEIAATIAKAEETGAAVLTAPVHDTIKRISGDRIIDTIDRSELRRALTPQCFKFSLFRRMMIDYFELPGATDESSLIEGAGWCVSYVDGGSRNIKITTAEDLAMVEFLMDR